MIQVEPWCFGGRAAEVWAHRLTAERTCWAETRGDAAGRFRGGGVWTVPGGERAVTPSQRLYPQRPLTSEISRRHHTLTWKSLSFTGNKKYCGGRRTDQSEGSVGTDAASSDSSSSVCSCTVLCVRVFVCLSVCVCVNTVQRNYFKEPVGCCWISYSSFCLVASASVFLLLLI